MLAKFWVYREVGKGVEIVQLKGDLNYNLGRVLTRSHGDQRSKRQVICPASSQLLEGFFLRWYLSFTYLGGRLLLI